MSELRCPACDATASRAWAPFKPFGRAIACDYCGACTFDMSRFGEWLWANTIALIWNGRIEVEQ